MSYKIKLGTISKYLESTARPNTETWDEYDVVFKDGTDVVNPTITLSISYDTVKAYNYAYMLDRYYWITSKTMTRTGLCVIQLETDVLATYKTEIGNADLYILRSSASYNGNLRDTLYPITGNVSYARETWDTPTYNFSNGVYVLNITGIQTTGTSTLIQLTPTNFKKLLTELYTAIDSYQVGDVLYKLINHFGGNPYKLINSAMWFPKAFTNVTASSDVHIGAWYAGLDGGQPIPCQIINDPQMLFDYCTIVLPRHPQATARGNYLNLAPYTNYTLYVPTAGVMSLDTTQLTNATAITVDRYIDALSGKMICYVQSWNTDPTFEPHLLGVLTGQFGVFLPLNGNDNGGGVVSGALTAIGGIAAIATGGATAAISGLGAAVGGIQEAITGVSVSSGGAAGSLVEINQPVTLDATFYHIASEDNAHRGRPYCATVKPANLGGFMIADRGDVDINGTLPEEEQIKTFLESGFYYE